MADNGDSGRNVTLEGEGLEQADKEALPLLGARSG